MMLMFVKCNANVEAKHLGCYRELMRLMGAKLRMTTAFHPQSDGQMEAANRVIVMYLRCFTGDRPRQWLRWLPWAEYIYNTAYQTSLHDTPFRVVYDRDPPTIRSYEPGETRLAAVAKSMADRDEFLEDVRYRLEQAQAVQKLHYDKLHRQVSYGWATGFYSVYAIAWPPHCPRRPQGS